MISRFVVAVSLSLGVAFSGCGDDAEGCVTSAGCEPSQMCVNGSCAARTGFDAGRSDGSSTDDGGSLDDGGSVDGAAEMDTGPAACGASCDTGDPCEEGAFDCESGEPVCVAVGASAAGVVCREAAGDCDAQEQCDGSSMECPADDRIGAGTECRESSGACDVAESCDGESPACPLDGFASTGTTCPAGFCDGSGTCSDTCTPNAACDPGVPCRIGRVDCSTGTPSCDLAGNDVDGSTCRATENGAYAGCGSFTSTCDEQGSQSRSVTAYGCDDGICAASVTSDSRNCSRGTDAVSCGMTITSGWGACGSFANSCDETGTRSRTVTTQACSMGSCDATPTTQSEGCSRVTTGLSCGAVVNGAWSACGGFSNTCDTTGTRSRSVTTPACASGSCGGVVTTETGGCSRASTDGTMCGATTTGPLGPCGGFTSACDETGTQTAERIDRVCDSGACTDVSTDEYTACSRSTTGNTCLGVGGMCNDYMCSGGICRTFSQCTRSQICCGTFGGCQNFACP